MAVVKSFAVPGSGMMFDLAFDGEDLYGAVGNDGYILGFDTTSGAITDSIHATYSSGNVRPFGLAYLASGTAGELWTSDGNYGSNMVNLWDFATTSWVDQWPSSPATYPCGIAYDPVSGYMWISCWSKDSIYIFDVGPAVGPTYWEILDPPLFPLPCAGHSEASTHDGYYYVFGISNTDTVLVYDIANNQWLDGTTNPYGAGKYGTANAVNGKFYRVGGTAAFPTPLQRIDILDPPNTWSAGATPPTGFLDQITGVYNDSLLFVFGSGQWSMTPTTDVYFYDTYLDSWTTCTSFPSPGRGAMAGGIIDSFAILAFGYTTGNNYSNDYVVGIIDETDPFNITWGAWVSTGLTGCRRVPSGADEFNKVLWVIGGQVIGGTGALNRTLSYDPYTDTWTDWAMPKPMSICNVTPLPITTTAAGDIGVFVGGGYSSSSYVGDHEVFHTGLYVGIEEKPVEKTETALLFGFAPDMPTLTKAYTAIKYTTTESRNVSLKIYNTSGRLVRTLVDRTRERSGTKTVYWNGKDNSGKTVTSGVYFFRLTAENKVATKKIVVIR